MGPQSTLAELYDELIVSVDGYAVNDQVLGPDASTEKIALHMDTYHKVAAADALFSGAAAAPEAETKVETEAK